MVTDDQAAGERTVGTRIANLTRSRRNVANPKSPVTKTSRDWNDSQLRLCYADHRLGDSQKVRSLSQGITRHHFGDIVMVLFSC